jgi:hypothetical protein
VRTKTSSVGTVRMVASVSVSCLLAMIVLSVNSAPTASGYMALVWVRRYGIVKFCHAARKASSIAL